MILKAPQFHSFTVSQNGMGGGVRIYGGVGAGGMGGGVKTVVSEQWSVVRKAGNPVVSEQWSVVRKTRDRGTNGLREQLNE